MDYYGRMLRKKFGPLHADPANTLSKSAHPGSAQIRDASYLRKLFRKMSAEHPGT
jgi:hypothetical protein